MELFRVPAFCFLDFGRMIVRWENDTGISQF